MKMFPSAFVPGIISGLVLVLGIPSIRAANSEWALDPVSGDWNTATNWTPAIVPNGASDVATFGLSNATNVSISTNTQVNGLGFTSAATDHYTITAGAGLTLTIGGMGIVNNSGIAQSFVAAVDVAGRSGQITLTNGATVGTATINNNGAVAWRAHGGFTQFNETSSAGNATISNNGGRAFNSSAFGSDEGGRTEFNNSSTAGSAAITNYGGAVLGVSGGFTQFNDNSSAASATMINYGTTVVSATSSFTQFNDNSSAASATIINYGATAISSDLGGITVFNNNSTAANATIINNGSLLGFGQTAFGSGATAANATIINNGGSTSFSGPNSSAGNATIINNNGGRTNMLGGSASNAMIINNSGGSTDLDGSRADNATIINNGASVSGASGGSTTVSDFAGGAALIVANGGINGGSGGSIFASSTSGTYRVELFGNGKLEIIANMIKPKVAVEIGSLGGDGNVFLGGSTLSVGSNNLSTTFSGVMQDGGENGGVGGSLTKIGSGTLDLTGTNSYTGNTNVNGGVLKVDGSITSNTFVNRSGTLAGTGIINGNVTNNFGGTISPADASGKLTVNGNYTQNGGTLLIDIAGGNADRYGVLDVLGMATLAGRLVPVLQNGFLPSVGEQFTFLEYGSYSGSLFIHDRNIDGLAEHWEIAYGSTGATLLVQAGNVAVPDQGSTLILLTLALLGPATYQLGRQWKRVRSNLPSAS